MPNIAAAGLHPGASLGECFHRSQTDVRFLGVLRPCNVSGYQSQQRTVDAAVGLLGWKLDLDDVSSRHILKLKIEN
jgi:hypothetical protein